MSFDTNWDVNKYWEEHESDDQWQLRKAFLLKWKDHYPEERLVCLARVFTNMEFMGCRYPSEIMHEVASLSADVAKEYRQSRKSKLKRTFVSASDAAEDRAKGVKRKGGVKAKRERKKPAKIEFIPQGQSDTTENNDISDGENETSGDRLSEQTHEGNMNARINIDDFILRPGSISPDSSDNDTSLQPETLEGNSRETTSIEPTSIKPTTIEPTPTKPTSIEPTPTNTTCIKPTSISTSNSNSQPTSNGLKPKMPVNPGINYMEDLMKCDCLDPRDFEESMFKTEFGKLVLVIRPWADMIANLTSTCLYSKIDLQQKQRQGVFTIIVNKKVLARVEGPRLLARPIACRQAWDKLRRIAVSLVIKEQWVTEGETRISPTDMSKKSEFGEPIEASVASKMMKLMGWKGGGLGADSQGISEPIKPILRMVRRAGLGHASNDMDQLKRAGFALMRRRGIALDADLVFASDFSSKERAVLHQCANQCGLSSKSYGKGEERFLVVTNKLKPFSLVKAVLERGGETIKYRVFIPATVSREPTCAP